MCVHSNNKERVLYLKQGVLPLCLRKFTRYCSVFVALTMLVGCLQNPPTEVDSEIFDISKKTSSSAAPWNMAASKWGISHHYLAGGTLDNAYYRITDYKVWNKYIAGFDVKKYANLAKQLGVGYVVFTITQNRGYLATTSGVYDKHAPPCPNSTRTPGCKNQTGVAKADYTPTRDLILDLGKALKEKGIRLIAYLPSHIPDRWTGKQVSPPQYPDWWITDFITEKSKAWGTNVAGWWFDGYWNVLKDEQNNKFPIAKKIYNAVLSGNPSARITFNTGHSSIGATVDPFSNYTAGEYNTLPSVPSSGVVQGYGHTALNPNNVQWVGWTFLAKKDPVFYGWGQIRRNLRFNSKDVAARAKAIADKGGLSTWDVAINPNGTWTAESLVQIQTIGNMVGTTTDKTYSSLKLINNDDKNIIYSAGQWKKHGNRPHGDYKQDVHYATADGAYLTYKFIGSSIVFATSKAVDQGNVEVYLDGTSQGVFSTHDGDYRQVQQIIFEKHDLSAGAHTLKLVKRSGTYMLVDILLSKK